MPRTLPLAHRRHPCSIAIALQWEHNNACAPRWASLSQRDGFACGVSVRGSDSSQASPGEHPICSLIALFTALVLLFVSSLSASEALHAWFHNDSHHHGHAHAHGPAEGQDSDHGHDATCALCVFSHSSVEVTPAGAPEFSAPTTWVIQPFHMPSSTVIVGLRLRPDGRGPPRVG